MRYIVTALGSNVFVSVGQQTLKSLLLGDSGQITVDISAYHSVSQAEIRSDNLPITTSYLRMRYGVVFSVAVEKLCFPEKRVTRNVYLARGNRL